MTIMMMMTTMVIVMIMVIMMTIRFQNKSSDIAGTRSSNKTEWSLIILSIHIC